MYEPLISVIVPVYNVERYLTKCVKSIENQTFKNIEIILIDDGSTDNSGKMCDQFALENQRIKVIHKKNGGLSDARNCGVSIARGEYIGFVDSDDFIHKDMYRTLYNLMVEYKVDITEIGYRSVFDGNDVTDEKMDPNSPSAPLVFDKECASIYCLMNYHSSNHVWDKLYKKEIWGQFTFPFGKHYEDYFIMFEVINSVSKIATLDLKLYYYVQRNGSIMRSSFSMKKHSDHLEADINMFRFFKETYPELLPVASIRFFEETIALLFMLVLSRKKITDFRKRVDYIRSMMLDNCAYIKDEATFNKVCIEYFPDNYLLLMKRRKRIVQYIALLKKSLWLFYYPKMLLAKLSHRLNPNFQIFD